MDQYKGNSGRIHDVVMLVVSVVVSVGRHGNPRQSVAYSAKAYQQKVTPSYDKK